MIARVVLIVLLAILAHAEEWSVCFSPKGNCTRRIVDRIDAAKSTIHVQAYGFSSRPIANALVAAAARGVAVHVIADKSNLGGNCQALAQVAATTHVLVDSSHAIAHNKVMILDEKTVITGSFNFTEGAENRNAENVLFVEVPKLAATYLANWKAHEEHSTPFQGCKR